MKVEMIRTKKVKATPMKKMMMLYLWILMGKRLMEEHFKQWMKSYIHRIVYQTSAAIPSQHGELECKAVLIIVICRQSRSWQTTIDAMESKKPKPTKWVTHFLKFQVRCFQGNVGTSKVNLMIKLKRGNCYNNKLMTYENNAHQTKRKYS